jgi:negative regulator of sigma-B (phosphoserine phosphatase)
MAHTLTLAGRVMSWGTAEALFPGEAESGDRYVVHPSADGVLIAAVDGAGHGREASVAARSAVGILQEAAAESPVSLMVRCHEALRRTRGAVMTLAFAHPGDETLAWLGVGNVEAVVFHADDQAGRAPEHVFLGSGMLGYQLPPLRVDVIGFRPRDTLIIATDGISPAFADDLAPNGDPQQIANRILARHWRKIDDALVVVARFL